MQPTQPGWYWDPKGMPGLFRWWDGEGWTDHVSVVRNVPAPETHSTAPPGAVGGRFHAGGLSCAALPEPWEWCPDYPHIDEAIGQQVVVGHTPRGNYIGCMFIGRVPDEYLDSGAELDVVGSKFSTAMLKSFYAHATPRDDAEPRTDDIAGHRAWRLVVQLDVEDDHLGFSREDAVFVLVDLPDRPGVLYASLPDVSDVAMPTADELIDDLSVD